jgi:hypothetical protein
MYYPKRTARFLARRRDSPKRETQKKPRGVRGRSMGTNSVSGRWFRDERGGRLARGSAYDAHLMPIVGQLFAAIETHHIGSDSRACRVAPGTGSDRHRKAIARVPAAKHCVHQSGEHFLPPQRHSARSFVVVYTFNTLDSKRAGKVRLKPD